MTKSSKKEIYIIIIAFSSIFLLTLISEYLSFQQINALHSITTDIYKHPLQVSNAALSIKSNVYKMNDSMKHILHSKSEEEIQHLSTQIDKIEQNTYENLNIIKEYILGDEGLKIQEDTKIMFDKCKQIRNDIFSLLQNNELSQAMDIIENQGTKNTLQLLQASDLLYQYAQNKASGFVEKSQKSYTQIKFLSYELGIIFLLLFFIIVYYTLKRIVIYIDKNEHLTSVLAVIRDVNQLIVREKDENLLIEKSCKILTETHVYSNVWIVIYDEDNNPKYCFGTDISEKFTSFKKDILNGWVPNCINKIIQNGDNYSYIQNRTLECSDCVLKDFYQTKSAFTVKLQYNNTLYGFLTLSLSNQFINDENEINLLEEVAGDIAYALYNLRNENEISRIKELYEHTLNSSKNLIFVKDTNFTYITCNSAFAEFVGKAKEEIIGKTDYELFDKEVADLFRGYDITMLSQKISTSNFEWVTYPDGKQVYLLTIKAPLQNKKGEVLGLVGNSVDMTHQKENWLLLEQKKKELETIIQEAPNPIMLHNEDGEVILINKAWEQLTGYNYEEINTIEKWTQKAHGKDMSIIKKHIKSLYDINQKATNEEYKITTKSGDTIIWKFYSTFLGKINDKKAVISSAMDVTELKYKEELLINQSRHAAMGEMISMIAHQWRQPLSIISMGANNMLLDIDLDTLNVSEVKKFSEDILNQTAHLSKTIDDFSNFFKPEKTVSKIKIEIILDETYAIVKDSLVNNNIQFINNIESHLEINIYKRELMQVFLNIINNAKYALIEKKIKNAFIKVRVYNDEQYLNIEFCDNAGGIDENIISKIFEPYFTTKNKNGTGLGLYMSKMIIEKHLHGIIEVKNTDVGVCFKVRLLIDNAL